jgi:hypothetical protein
MEYVRHLKHALAILIILGLRLENAKLLAQLDVKMESATPTAPATAILDTFPSQTVNSARQNATQNV